MIFISIIREWRELLRFRSLNPDSRSIVFYAEDFSSWTYFEHIIEELTGGLDKYICYVTSSRDDPVLKSGKENIQTFYIGAGSARTAFFSTLETDVMVMTMPDLGNYYIKRSKAQVHYVYVNHSLCSTHMSYRHRAFDNFDAFLCVGPHQKEELRATEELYGLEPKILIEAGFGRIDAIVGSQESSADHSTNDQDAPKRILVAASWGEQSLLENHGQELVGILLETRHHITVRPHVMTLRHEGKQLDRLQREFGANPNFTLDLGLRSQGVMADYDLMIADWGGSALEFAFGLERPVLFIDMPRKVFNPEYEEIPCVPMEVEVRSDIGDVVSPDSLDEIPRRIESLLKDPSATRGHIQKTRSKWVYNLGCSGRVGAKYIADTARSAKGVD